MTNPEEISLKNEGGQLCLMFETWSCQVDYRPSATTLQQTLLSNDFVMLRNYTGTSILSNAACSAGFVRHFVKRFIQYHHCLGRCLLTMIGQPLHNLNTLLWVTLGLLGSIWGHLFFFGGDN